MLIELSRYSSPTDHRPHPLAWEFKGEWVTYVTNLDALFSLIGPGEELIISEGGRRAEIYETEMEPVAF